jgi:tetratricopeptide (TPR) repeat protein
MAGRYLFIKVVASNITVGWILLLFCLDPAENQKRSAKSSSKKSTAGSRLSTGNNHCALDREASLDALLREGSQNYARNLAVAEECYKIAVEMYPTSPLALYNYGLTQLNQGKTRLSEKSFKRAIQLAPQYGEAYFGLGSALSQSGMNSLPDTKRALQTAVKLAPRMYAAYNQLGNVLLAEQRLPEALKAYQTVVELSPRSPEGHANLARIYSGLGRNQDALSSLMMAISLAPANPHLYLEIGVVAKNSKLEAAARRFFATAIRLLPSFASAHYQVPSVLSR